MRVNPQYDGAPLIVADALIADPAPAMIRQRRRLADVLGTLDADQWAAPSRCAGWSVQDVIAHLVGVNQFWTLSISRGLAGDPTRILAGFDPVETPKLMVSGMTELGARDVLAQFVATNEELEQVVAGIAGDTWTVLAEAPPGHLAVRAVVLHALWDAWIHERDIVVPLGLEQPAEPDELLGSLGYAAALGPAFGASNGSSRVGTLRVAAREPDLLLAVDIASTVTVRPDHDAATPHVAGGAVDLIEAFSFRAPPLTIDPSDQWMLEGLGTVFDQ